MAKISNEKAVANYTDQWTKAHEAVEAIIGGVKYIRKHRKDQIDKDRQRGIHHRGEDYRVDFDTVQLQIQQQLEKLRDTDGKAQALFEKLSNPGCGGIVKSRLRTLAGFGFSGLSSVAAFGVQYVDDTYPDGTKDTKIVIAKKALPVIVTVAIAASGYFYGRETQAKKFVDDFEKEITKKDNFIVLMENVLEMYEMKLGLSPRSLGKQPTPLERQPTSMAARSHGGHGAVESFVFPTAPAVTRASALEVASSEQLPASEPLRMRRLFSYEIDEETEDLLAEKLIKACPRSKPPKSLHDVKHLIVKSPEPAARSDPTSGRHIVQPLRLDLSHIKQSQQLSTPPQSQTLEPQQQNQPVDPPQLQKQDSEEREVVI